MKHDRRAIGLQHRARGILNPDGSIAYRGQRYCVQALVQAVGSSFRFVAEAIAV